MSLRHRGRVSLDGGWRFRFQDEDWEQVRLPHSWNALDTMSLDENRYRRGTGVYERELQELGPSPGRRLWLEVEAASQKAQVIADGVGVGGHAGGYTAFTVELPPAARQLVVRVDNSPDPDLIPSNLSDFFLYGGLTRRVWLYSTGPARIVSVRVEAEVQDGVARVVLVARQDGEDELSAELRAPDGSLVGEATGRTRLEFGELATPRCWSPDDPALYTATVRAGASDEVSLRLGLRSFGFPESGTFEVNGKSVKLWGTHRHEDWAGMGSAVPEELTRRELELARRAGFNFIRLGHYPQSPAVLDACDELGLVVWEELPWCRGGVGGHVFEERAGTMLAEMIEQHQHHPSIAFWGLGNELDWEVSDHLGSTEEAVLEFLGELNEMAHRLDPGRLTALRRFEPGAAVVDVYSPSNWSGWYRGRYQDYEAALAALLPRYRRLLHIEWGADSHVGRHGLGPHLGEPLPELSDHGERPGDALTEVGPPRASRDGDWSESYALDLFEWHLQVQARSPLAGSAQWALKDFGTPLRPENPIPYVNQKGLLDRAGRPKDAYHLFASYLSSEPVCHLESPTWPVRVGEHGRPERVRLYSNLEEAELFLNGVSQGRRRRDPTAFPAAGLAWDVQFSEGRNELRACAFGPGGRRLQHRIEQEFRVGPAAAAAGLLTRGSADRTPDGEESILLEAQLVDPAGLPCVDERRRITFRLEGSGRLWGDRGTVDGSRVVEAANGRAAIHVLREGVSHGFLVVEAEGVQPARVTLGSV
jgi:beta-galactosidase